ncbi:unnamed protein product [Brassica oleracea var. botrytis]
MAMQSTEENVQSTEVLSFISGIVGSLFIAAVLNALSWFISLVFNALVWFIATVFNALVWLIAAVFNALVWLISAVFNALSWLVLGIRNGLWFLITNIALRVSLLCNSMVRPMTLVRLFGAGMILATFFLFNSSESNRDIILALIEKPEPVTEDIPLLPLTTQPTVSPSIQNQSDAVAKKEEEESCQVLDMSGVVRGDQKVLYRPGSFTRVRSNTDEVGYN